MFKSLIMFLVPVLMIIGCNSTQKNTKPTNFGEYKIKEELGKADANIEDVNNKIKEGTDEIIKDANKIKDNAGKVNVRIPNDIRPDVKEYIEKIIAKANNQISVAEKMRKETHNKLVEAQLSLDVANQKNNRMEKIVEKSVEERDSAFEERDVAIEAKEKAEAKSAANIKNMMLWLIVGGVIVAAVGGVLLFNGRVKVGPSIIAGGIIVIGLSIMISQYLMWIAVAFGVISIGLISYLIYIYIIKDKALEEVVETAEITKNRLSPADRRDLFGYGPEKGLAGQVQSKTTVKEILEKRKKLRPHWEHTVPETATEMDLQDKEIRKASGKV